MASLPCVEGFSSVAHPPESSSIAKSFSKGKRSPSPVTPPSTKRIALSKSFVESPTTIGVKSLSSQGIRSKKKSFQGLKQKGGCSHTKMLKFDLNPDFFWSSFKNTHDCLFCWRGTWGDLTIRPYWHLNLIRKTKLVVLPLVHQFLWMMKKAWSIFDIPPQSLNNQIHIASPRGSNPRDSPTNQISKKNQL